jgi:hypothetical protein
MSWEDTTTKDGELIKEKKNTQRMKRRRSTIVTITKGWDGMEATQPSNKLIELIELIVGIKNYRHFSSPPPHSVAHGVLPLFCFILPLFLVLPNFT